jgi:hypothetical protein
MSRRVIVTCAAWYSLAVAGVTAQSVEQKFPGPPAISVLSAAAEYLFLSRGNAPLQVDPRIATSHGAAATTARMHDGATLVAVPRASAIRAMSLEEAVACKGICLSSGSQFMVSFGSPAVYGDSATLYVNIRGHRTTASGAPVGRLVGSLLTLTLEHVDGKWRVIHEKWVGGS